jgi:putative oxygen-independent coproporphyrinogen III oxidase
MSGIYVHVPFCKVKCHYCDFHFSTNSSNATEMVEAICAEIAERSAYLHDEEVSTIYFGGGTPSLLNQEQLKSILSCIRLNFQVKEDAEITLEANPDDLSRKTLDVLKAVGVNRLSIGVQSFDDEVLQSMNRAHSSNEATQCIKDAQATGFSNLTADLIYGVPNKGIDYWKEQLEKLLELNIQHLSAYCLTIEPKTVFAHQQRYGEINLPSDDVTLQQFKLMQKILREHGFLHYEISNFAQEGYISKHNSAYWLGNKYLGVGPSAHSYDGEERRWNVSNNIKYIQAVFAGDVFHEREMLTPQTKFNDYILTRLRTHWGLELDYVQTFNEYFELAEFNKQVQKHLGLQNLILINNVLRLSDHGKFIADAIASDLFV